MFRYLKTFEKFAIIEEFEKDSMVVSITNESEDEIGYIILESNNGVDYTIVDASINEDWRMKGYYRKAILEILDKNPSITILSLFRSTGADWAWKKLIQTLPSDYGYEVIDFKEENTKQYKLFKK